MKIKKQLPRKVKKKRKLYLNDGLDGGWEEHWDYVFPEEHAVESSLKLLQMARKWKQQEGEEEDEDSSERESEGGDVK